MASWKRHFPDKTKVQIKQAWLQGTPGKNQKTHQWPKLIQYVSVVVLNYCTTKATDQAFLKTLYVKKSQAIWLGNQIFGSKLKNQPVKLLEMTESIYYFKGSLLILLGKPTHNAYLTFGIPFGMPRSTWCKLMNLSMINHKQKINFRPDLILEI